MSENPKATFNKPVNTDKWRVMFTIAHTCLVSNRDEAENVTDLINLAYKRGRTDLQRELRELLAAERSSTPGATP
jgi:hypothetical protein